MSKVKQYADRDAMALDEAGGYYMRHVMAMTGEQLHGKGDIAAELGWRDMQIAALQQKLDAVLAENVALKSAFNPEVIPEEAVEAFTETAIMDHDWDDTGAWSWVENDTDVIRAVMESLKPETPATDVILNEVRAEGIEVLTSRMQQLIDEGVFDAKEIGVAAGVVYEGAQIATQLRAGSTEGGVS